MDVPLPTSLSSTYKSVRIPGDGNCFFRAISLAVFETMDNHLELREEAMKILSSESETYKIYFETLEEFQDAVKTCSNDGAWNNDLIDIAPLIVSQCIEGKITIYNYRNGTVDDPVVFSNGEKHSISLLRLYDSHYNLLIPKDSDTPSITEDDAFQVNTDEDNWDRPESDSDSITPPELDYGIDDEESLI